MKKGKLVLAISLIPIAVFLIYIITQYGWDNLPSISKSAKYLTQEGKSEYFFMFITILCFAMGYVGNSSLTIFGGGILWMIVTFTGYNRDLEIKELQNTFHVICTLICIVSILGEMLRRGIKWVKEKKYWLWIFSFLLLFGILFGISYMWFFNIKNHTFLIEALIITSASLFFFVTPLNIGKNKTVQKAVDMTKSVKAKTVNTVKKAKEKREKPTPIKWVKIGKGISALGKIAASIGAIYKSPVLTIGALVFGEIGKWFTDFASE